MSCWLLSILEDLEGIQCGALIVIVWYEMAHENPRQLSKRYSNMGTTTYIQGNYPCQMQFCTSFTCVQRMYSRCIERTHL